MKAVILAGGLGTRISEESYLRPKPMIEIGSMPILWHIMKIYSTYNINEFIICCGYKGYMIKEYFANYYLHSSDIRINIKDNNISFLNNNSEAWTITLIDTGQNTMTGGRLKKIYDYVKDENFFHMTYGDGVSDINIQSLTDFHIKSNLKATITATTPPGRFGVLDIKDNKVTQFREKAKKDEALINAGFFVLSPECLKLIDDDKTIWEKFPLETLAKENNLAAYIHDGFWQAMDTLRDKNYLDSLWDQNQAPWKKW